MLEAVDLACVRGARHLFRGVNFRLQRGQILHIRGPNGSGKTSLLRLLCGLSLPAAGAVLWNRAPIAAAANRADFHRALFHLGHRNALHGDLSALANLRAACALAGHARSDAACAEALQAMGVRELLPCRALSAGQLRRAALAALLLRRGGLWLLDEPATALDDAAVRQLQALLESQAAGGGIVVFTSHRDLAAGRARQLDLADFA